MSRIRRLHCTFRRAPFDERRVGVLVTLSHCVPDEDLDGSSRRHLSIILAAWRWQWVIGALL